MDRSQLIDSISTEVTPRWARQLLPPPPLQPRQRTRQPTSSPQKRNDTDSHTSSSLTAQTAKQASLASWRLQRAIYAAMARPLLVQVPPIDWAVSSYADSVGAAMRGTDAADAGSSDLAAVLSSSSSLLFPP
jgi:hypothetical protein